MQTRDSVQKGCPISHSIIYFWPKNILEICSCQSISKYFLLLILDPHRPCFDITLISDLTSQLIYNPSQLDHKWRKEWQIWLWHQFYHGTINCKHFWNWPFELSIDTLTTNPPKSNITWSAITQRLVNQFF